MTDLQGWSAVVTLAVGFIGVIFVLGDGWGRVQSELHRLCERIMDGFKRNEDDHAKMQGIISTIDSDVESLRDRVSHIEGQHDDGN